MKKSSEIQVQQSPQLSAQDVLRLCLTQGAQRSSKEKEVLCSILIGLLSEMMNVDAVVLGLMRGKQFALNVGISEEEYDWYALRIATVYERVRKNNPLHTIF